MIYFDMKKGKVVMDRTESGLTDFGKKAVHVITNGYSIIQKAVV